MTSDSAVVLCTRPLLALIFCFKISSGHYYPHHYFAHQSQFHFGFAHHVPFQFQGWPAPPPSPSVSSQPIPIWPPVQSTIPAPKPTFSFQPMSRDLKPSITGWDTTFNVPCGTYSIHPFVIARIRYSSGERTQGTGKAYHTWARSNSPISERQSSESFSFPLSRGRRSFSMPEIYQVPVSYPKPATCDWNFRAIGPCRLKFTCSWFQMPALFRCDENYIELTDGDTFKYKFCGSRKPRGPYVSTKDSIKLSFKSQPAYSVPTVFDCAVTCSVDLVNREVAPYTQPVQQPSKLTNPLVELPIPSPTPPPKPVLKYADCKCGIRGEPTTSTRIIGGSQTFPGEFPWTAALVRTNKLQPFCGGTLLNNFYVLSAAHCISRRDARFGENEGAIEVLLNEHDITSSYDNSKIHRSIRVKISKIIVHPKYQNTTYDNDIVLLRLAESVDLMQEKIENIDIGNSSIFSSTIATITSTTTLKPDVTQREKRFFARGRNMMRTPKLLTPICLPTGREERSFQDKSAIVTGFGLTKEGGIPSNTMLKASVKIFNDSSCRQFYRGNNVLISENMLCAGHVLGKMDSCVGDSGGPLVVDDKDRFVLAGIVSWGSGCGRPNKPGVYTKISKDTIEWIQAKTYEDSIWCRE